MKTERPITFLQGGEMRRRSFIRNAIKAGIGTAVALSLPGPGFGNKHKSASYTVGDIMDIILKAVPGAPFAQTVDTLKSGSRDSKVTGVITTMFATVKTIEMAISSGVNFIIAHEPTFYNHTDDKEWVSPNHIVDQKLKLLNDHKITVWRLHDYIHSFVPDGVTYGVVKKAGWLPYFSTGSSILEVPEISLTALAEHLKTSLSIAHLRIIGPGDMPCKKIALLPGASGGQRHMEVVEKNAPDVLVVGEVHEWETAEYIRDTLALGGKTALIVLGHSVSEEPGMEWLQGWLQPQLPGVKVTHVVAGNPFTWV